MPCRRCRSRWDRQGLGVVEQMLQPGRQGEHLCSVTAAVSPGRCLHLLLLPIRPDDHGSAASVFNAALHGVVRPQLDGALRRGTRRWVADRTFAPPSHLVCGSSVRVALLVVDSVRFICGPYDSV